MKTNYNYRRVGRDTIRLAFQIPGPYDREPFKLWRIRPEEGKHLFHLEGFFLNEPKRKTRVAVSHVRPGDILMITHLPRNGETPPHNGFHVEENGAPTPVTDLSPFFENHLVSHGPTLDFDGHRFIHFNADDVCTFMTAKHPAWLQDHVNATLRIWRTSAPDLFYSVAPAPWLVTKPWRLASHDPRRVLEEDSGKLGNDLRKYCIRRLLPQKDRSIGRMLPSTLKPVAHYENAAFLLRRYSMDLNDQQLRLCAAINPSAAIAHYPHVTDSRHRALLISCAFQYAWPNRALMRDPGFQQDVIDSLTEHCAEWIISQPKGLVAVIQMIADRIPLRPTPDELVRMMALLEPHARQCVADFVSSRI